MPSLGGFVPHTYTAFFNEQDILSGAGEPVRSADADDAAARGRSLWVSIRSSEAGMIFPCVSRKSDVRFRRFVPHPAY